MRLIIEELKFLGETWTIHHPSLLRCYRHWLQNNADAIAMSGMEYGKEKSRVFSPASAPLFSMN
ncbi:MAG: hypothetical protein JRJ16_16170 [Deltaproteobacteria bacterium]|nr:hypothetical protein [Deltaproteobacteria bacterium]